jgi:hypothetical protein
VLITALLTSIGLTLVVLLFMLVVRVLVRHGRAATVVAWAFLTALYAASAGVDVSFPWLTGSIVTAIAVALLTRGGLVALGAASFVASLLIVSPLTSDFHAWYSPAGTLAVLLSGALLVYGFATARARPRLAVSSGAWSVSAPAR